VIYLKMMNLDLYKLQTLVENFKNEIIGDSESVRHKCFCISYPLSLYLQINGYHNSLKGGNFLAPLRSINHTWIELNNGIIIDATIEQFSEYLSIKDLPFMFLNDFENDNLNTDKHNKWFQPLKNNDEWFEKTSNGFKEYFKNIHRYIGEDSVGIDIRELLKISLKAAIIINKEIDKRRIDVNHINRTDTKECLTYFNFISYMINTSNNKDLSPVISEFKNNEDYHNLTSKIQSIQID